MSGTISTRWYFPDWISDANVRACSLAARGLWMDLLCIAGMNREREHGYVLIAGRAPTPQEIGRFIGASEEEVKPLLDELEKNKVFSRDRRGIIYSRRMVRAEKNRGNGRLGGNPNILKMNTNRESLQLEPKAHIPEPEPEPKKEKEVLPRKRGCRLPEDWSPNPNDRGFAAERNLAGSALADEVAKFRNYWHSKAGKDAVGLDWPARWRTWCMNWQKWNGGKNGKHNGQGSRRGGYGQLLADIEQAEQNRAPDFSEPDGSGDTGPLLDIVATERR